VSSADVSSPQHPLSGCWGVPESPKGLNELPSDPSGNEEDSPYNTLPLLPSRTPKGVDPHRRLCGSRWAGGGGRPMMPHTIPHLGLWQEGVYCPYRLTRAGGMGFQLRRPCRLGGEIAPPDCGGVRGSKGNDEADG